MGGISGPAETSVIALRQVTVFGHTFFRLPIRFQLTLPVLHMPEFGHKSAQTKVESMGKT
jgi:hypothetical protein